MGIEKIDVVPNKGICFVISPMGDEDSEARKQSELLLRDVIEPAANACGYTVYSPLKLPGSKPIMSEIIRHLVSAPLVIADLSGENANVFYELALRHAVRKPFIQIMAKTSKLTFDVKTIRTIRFDISSVSSQTKAKNELIDFIKEAEKFPLPETPISDAHLNTWFPFTNRETTQPKQDMSSEDRKRLNDWLAEFLETTAIPPELRPLIKELMGSSRVYRLRDTGGDLDAASTLVKKVQPGGRVSATSSLQLQYHDADERFIYREVLNEALKRNVTYRKIICSSSEIDPPRYETWMAEFAEKANFIRNGSINAETFQLLHYPHPMSVDVLISQDENERCCDMVAGFFGGEGHGGFKTDDQTMVGDWLDVYIEGKIIPVAKAHTEDVRNGLKKCDCLEFLTLLENANRDRNKAAEDGQDKDSS